MAAVSLSPTVILDDLSHFAKYFFKIVLALQKSCFAKKTTAGAVLEETLALPNRN